VNKCPLLIFVIMLLLSNVQGQTADSLWRNSAPKLYIQDETYLDLNYIKNEIIFVNYVRERQNADIHLIITFQKTASSGREYSLQFIGLNDYKDINYTLKQTTQPDATDDDIRSALNDAIKRGLVPYMTRTGLRDMFNVEFTPPTGQTEVIDKWHNWVFSMSLDGYGTGEKLYSYLYYSFYPTVQRITEKQKITINGGVTRVQRMFVIDDTTKLTTKSHSYFGDAFCGWKLSEHFSAGGWFGYTTSFYNNIKLGLSIAPKFEYNFVPYSENVKHKISVQFEPVLTTRSYYDTTLYNRMSETRLRNELELGATITRKWGTLGLTIEGSNYLHDLSKNNLSIEGNISWRVISGLSLSVMGGYSFIRDQLSLRKEGASEQERLLRLREIETGYSYWISFGLTYTFGSIYSNIVNPIF